VRQAAEDQIEKSALADGILDKARENARTNVTGLLAGLGFKNVQVGSGGIETVRDSQF
jgi:hypothetical protein